MILRSDFRTCGEKEIGSDDWNFMCSFFPRTKIVGVNAILSYQKAVEGSRSKEEALDRYYNRIADLVIENLDAARKETPLLKSDRKKLEFLYQWALTFPGSGIDKLLPDEISVDRIVTTKVNKGLV